MCPVQRGRPHMQQQTNHVKSLPATRKDYCGGFSLQCHDRQHFFSVQGVPLVDYQKKGYRLQNYFTWQNSSQSRQLPSAALWRSPLPPVSREFEEHNLDFFLPALMCQTDWNEQHQNTICWHPTTPCVHTFSTCLITCPAHTGEQWLSLALLLLKL